MRLAWVMVACALAGAAQETATLKSEARLVALPAVVTEKKGALVNNLAKEDFVLTVDGAPQAIRYFDRDQDLPLTLGLLVDTSRSQRDVIDEERDASKVFLEQMLRAPAAEKQQAAQPDRAFLLQFARQSELLVDLTDSKPKLQAGLRELAVEDRDAQPPDDGQSDGSGGGRRGGMRGGGGTVLYDAVFLASDEVMAKQKGRKALVVLTDGEDRGSRESLTKAIEAAQRADTMVYAIYFKGQEGGGGGFGNGGGGRHGGIGFPGGGGGGWPGGGGGQGGGGGNGGGGRGQRGGEERGDGKKVLERMCGETGGRLFEVTKKQTMAAIYTQIGEELRSQYRIGFTPTEAEAADGYHELGLTVPAKKGLVVRTRDGYYGGSVRQ